MIGRLRSIFRRRPALELRARELGTLLLLTPSAFERAVADLLSEMGYRDVKVSGGPGDLAADITARSPEGRRTIVQCKQYAPGRTVGSKEMQQFIGMAVTHHKAERSIYVTTGSYTAPAQQLAQRHGIELIDGDRLAELLLEVRGPSDPATADIDPGALVAAGIYDPNKVAGLPPERSHIGAPLIAEPVLAIGLPKPCDECEGEAEWSRENLRWECEKCGAIDDWAADAELAEWPERHLVHQFVAALNAGDAEAAAGFFRRGAVVTFLSGPMQALRSGESAVAWVEAFPLVLQPLTAWASEGMHNHVEMFESWDRASGFPAGQLTALLSLQAGQITQLFTNPA